MSALAKKRTFESTIRFRTLTVVGIANIMWWQAASQLMVSLCETYQRKLLSFENAPEQLCEFPYCASHHSSTVYAFSLIRLIESLFTSGAQQRRGSGAVNWYPDDMQAGFRLTGETPLDQLKN